jgi:predicted ArsR family transcriptional regulator
VSVWKSYYRDKLTPLQEQVLDRVTRWHDDREPISLSDLAREFGIHYVSFKQHLEALDRKGLITFQSRGRGRTPIVRTVRS